MQQATSQVLRSVSSALNVPVIIILILLMALTVLLLGNIIVEYFTERRLLKVKLPDLIDELKANPNDLDTVIRRSNILNRQKRAALELLRHPELNDVMLESLAVQLLDEERVRYNKIVKWSDIISKLGPMFGLLGTLIPLGPGIVALGQGDTYTLSESLLTAFDTTVAGLISAAVATVISTIRKGWYGQYMTMLETIMTCILEALKDAEK